MRLEEDKLIFGLICFFIFVSPWRSFLVVHLFLPKILRRVTKKLRQRCFSGRADCPDFIDDAKVAVSAACIGCGGMPTLERRFGPCTTRIPPNILKPTARDHLRKKVNRERCYLRRCKLQLVDQVADARDLPVARRALNQITVRVIHKGEFSNEQEKPERWISRLVAAG